MRTPYVVVSLVAFVAATPMISAPAEPAPPPSCAEPGPVRRMDDLVRMSRADLEDLFHRSEMTAPPSGFVRGRAIYKPGSRLTVPASNVTRVVWQGKVFRDDGIMVNRVFGLRAVHARIYSGLSTFDGQPALILDYCGTSKLFPNVWDEVRQVSPGLYIGLTYVRRDTGPELAMFFALDARHR